jgi:hypothetical protein
MTSVVKAMQLSVSGVVTNRRALFKQVIIFHPISSDTVYEFYDLTEAPTGSEPHYDLAVYGKTTQTIPMPEPGVLFDDGIYVKIPDGVTGTTVTVLYEEV